jgi:DNA-binding IscR family transcriptional regulator
LVTQRGANGGYQLAGIPEEVTLVEIIEGVEGPIAVNDCVDGAQDPCAVSNCCFMSSNWNKVNQTVRDALKAVSLADLIDPAQLFPEISPPVTAAVTGAHTSSVKREEEVPHGRNH